MANLLFTENSLRARCGLDEKTGDPLGFGGGRKQRSGLVRRETREGQAPRPDVSPELLNLAGVIFFWPGGVSGNREKGARRSLDSNLLNPPWMPVNGSFVCVRTMTERP